MFYVNLRSMRDQPVYELEALAHHEGIPGHHMQIAIAQELTGVPKFRKFGARFTAYSEGWGLYSEQTPKEIGMYEDPYSDFGRLTASNSEANCLDSINRYIVLPSQATAYKIGMLKIPGIVSIPLGFLAAFVGAMIRREPEAEAKFAELSVRANTGLGAEKPSPV